MHFALVCLAQCFAFVSGFPANAGAAVATTIAAMTKATERTKRMRCISITSFPRKPIVEKALEA
jgi:hypothetical protein